jgi:hypothetical protein
MPAVRYSETVRVLTSLNQKGDAERWPPMCQILLCQISELIGYAPCPTVVVLMVQVVKGLTEL